MIPCLKDNRHESFIKNGAVLLEELIAFCNGRSNPIHHFSEKELLRATNYYDSRNLFMQNGSYKMYRGTLNDCPIFVKNYEKYPIGDPYKDIVVGSQMSAHKNVLKVLGCCLETKEPAIVHEFGGTKLLSTCLSTTDVDPLPWKCRLKIARDLANAIAYLHTAFSRPVIHRLIKSSLVMLDQNNVPKLVDFDLCISIPEGESHVQDAIIGTYGYLAP